MSAPQTRRKGHVRRTKRRSAHLRVRYQLLLPGGGPPFVA